VQIPGLVSRTFISSSLRLTGTDPAGLLSILAVAAQY
jgi:hypothetical protein